MIRAAARVLLTRAVRGRREHGSEWGEAILAEFDETPGQWSALRWAAGGVRIAVRERMRLRPERPRWVRVSRRAAAVLVAMLVAGMAVQQFALTVAYIPTESMAPTLRVSDRVLVDRAAYRLDGLDYGDLIVFDLHDPDVVAPVRMVRRLVALPGDAVDCRDGHVRRNGVPVDEPYLADTRTDCQSVTVPDGTVYVLGDERSIARDSRHYGPVPVDSITGRVLIRVPG